MTADKIWDDESGLPSPFSVADVDARLNALGERQEQEMREIIARTQELEALAARKEALVNRLTTFLHEVNAEREAIDARLAVLTVASRRSASNKTRSGSPSRSKTNTPS